MGTEVEVKHLVEKDDWRSSAHSPRQLEQGYLVKTDTIEVRVRTDSVRAWSAIKGSGAGRSRLEVESEISLEDYAQLLHHCGSNVLIKTRWLVGEDTAVWEVDEYHGSLSGLVTAELELADELDSYQLPPWLGREVSDDSRYRNASLAHHGIPS